ALLDLDTPVSGDNLGQENVANLRFVARERKNQRKRDTHFSQYSCGQTQLRENSRRTYLGFDPLSAQFCARSRRSLSKPAFRPIPRSLPTGVPRTTQIPNFH